VRCCYATSLEQIKLAMSRVADFLDETKARRGGEPARALASA
jgi:hypothetical protein